MKERNRLMDIVLKEGEKEGKIYFHTTMSEIDKFGYSPEEDNNGRFFFVITYEGIPLKFYQYSDIPNVFSDDFTTQAYIFKPDEEYDVELHIINDYE